MQRNSKDAVMVTIRARTVTSGHLLYKLVRKIVCDNSCKVPLSLMIGVTKTHGGEKWLKVTHTLSMNVKLRLCRSDLLYKSL